MPWTDGTLTDEDVAAELGVPVDSRVTVATDAARAWGQTIRPTLTPSELWGDAERHRGGVYEGCYQYLLRADPQGMPQYEEFTANPWALHLEAERRVRPDPVIA